MFDILISGCSEINAFRRNDHVIVSEVQLVSSRVIKSEDADNQRKEEEEEGGGITKNK